MWTVIALLMKRKVSCTEVNSDCDVFPYSYIHLKTAFSIMIVCVSARLLEARERYLTWTLNSGSKNVNIGLC
jgi:hypothetical protein